MNAESDTRLISKPRAQLWVRPAAIALGVLLPLCAAAVALRGFRDLIEVYGPVEGWLVIVGKAAGLAAAVLLMAQFALSARLKLLDRAFGLDRLLRLHRCVGAAAAVLACLHPFLIYVPKTLDIGPVRWEIWPELLGVCVLVTVCVIACTSIWRIFLLLPYRTWWWIHQLVFPAAVGASVSGSA